jgi:hypothetical protein
MISASGVLNPIVGLFKVFVSFVLVANVLLQLLSDSENKLKAGVLPHSVSCSIGIEEKPVIKRSESCLGEEIT